MGKSTLLPTSAYYCHYFLPCMSTCMYCNAYNTRRRRKGRRKEEESSSTYRVRVTGTWSSTTFLPHFARMQLRQTRPVLDLQYGNRRGMTWSIECSKPYIDSFTPAEVMPAQSRRNSAPLFDLPSLLPAEGEQLSLSNHLHSTEHARIHIFGWYCITGIPTACTGSHRSRSANFQ